MKSSLPSHSVAVAIYLGIPSTCSYLLKGQEQLYTSQWVQIEIISIIDFHTFISHF